MRLSRLVSASAALAVVAAGFTAPAGIAAPPVDSNLVANPAAVTVNVNVSPDPADPAHSATVEVKLDENCAQATDATEYTIAAGDTGGFFTVTPALSDPLDCSESATFTITGVAVTPETPATLLHFSPIGKNEGVQKKLGSGVDVQVTVVDTTPDGGPPPCTTDCPVPGARPAAPAVANGLLNMNAELAQACKDTFKTKNWRGRVISTIADTMPKPASVRDDTTVFETDDDWVAFVKSGSPAFSGFSGLYNICGYSEASSV